MKSFTTGFKMGVTAIARVLTRLGWRARQIPAQPGNWVRFKVIELINCHVWAPYAKTIFASKLHQASWYEFGVPAYWR